MQCSDVIAVLEELAPKEYACDWDNVGFLVGNPQKEIKRIYIALDATDEVIEEAICTKADLILTHHPMIFSGMKQVTTNDFIGRRIVRLIQEDIACYAMHTNFDVCVMGALAAEHMGLQEVTVLEETGIRREKPCGIGSVGLLPKPMTLNECASMVKERFDTGAVKVFGEPDTRICKVAICPGSGGSEIAHALDAGADVLITGDIDHHEGIDAVAQGLVIVDAGHYGLEHIFVPYMAEYLKQHVPELKIEQREHILPFRIL